MREPLKSLKFHEKDPPVHGRRTRFAPSPTGYLHLGHVAAALWVWVIGRKIGASIDLRMEDHDRSRCRPEYEQAILEDLAWLGFMPDRGLSGDGRSMDPLFRQSSHPERYQKWIDQWSQAGESYACQCSRKEIQQADPGESARELRYPGTCRSLRIPVQAGIGVRRSLPRQSLEFWDAIANQSYVQCPAEQCGDLLLRERGGSFTYQFCVVVDDIHDGIDLVIRGQDLLDSTGRQLQLAKLMGSSRTIAYGHHPVLRDDQGNKLSKRQRSDSIAAMRQAGATAQQVLGRAAMLMGLQDSDLPRELTEFRAEVQQNG